MYDKKTVQTAQRLVLHDSLRTYKVKNSRFNLAGQAKETPTKKGAIALFSSKESMQKSHGVVVTSFEALGAIADRMTHWTPNTFNWLGYTQNRANVRGHREDNLAQINTLVVDIDFADAQERDAREQEVLGAVTVADLFIPTMILRTAKGYHVYYVFDHPMFLRKKQGQFPVLKAAQKMSSFVRQWIQKRVAGVDVGCNNFGIFRIPRQDNLVFFDAHMLVQVSALMKWSQYYATQVPVTKPDNRQVISLAPDEGRQVDQVWFKALLKVTTVKSGQGLARHNTVLTLALAMYQSKVSQQRARDVLDVFNSNLHDPLADREVVQCVRDAYSGNYRGAALSYVQGLLDQWVPNFSGKVVTGMGWHKFAKPRSERQYSHAHEWRRDVLALINRMGGDSAAVAMSTRQIQSELGISPASLNRVLKQLQAAYQLKKVQRGNQPTLLTTVTMLFKSAMVSRQAQSQAWKGYLTTLVPTIATSGYDLPLWTLVAVQNMGNSAPPWEKETRRQTG
ncbi:primase C-terminal domain-containing protein [Levilactobacillus brevis]|uniref:Primase C-terminal domain-containing protein n=2 Tax=Levilactobacillus brevis TaxID=1580 RepID=A0AA41ERZ1_LEVBR|nr:primase C-terminal domain-containing protein [Levilactobacillus brevis]MBS1011778.1 primase C-terminal domain-containing protein [Levilactobacillus brevis]